MGGQDPMTDDEVKQWLSEWERVYFGIKWMVQPTPEEMALDPILRSLAETRKALAAYEAKVIALPVLDRECAYCFQYLCGKEGGCDEHKHDDDCPLSTMPRPRDR